MYDSEAFESITIQTTAKIIHESRGGLMGFFKPLMDENVGKIYIYDIKSECRADGDISHMIRCFTRPKKDEKESNVASSFEEEIYL